MLRALRRCRALAVALLLAVPGLGGTWLSVAHPCPVDLPWVAQAGHAAHGSQGHGHAPADAPSGCHCVGACHSGASPLVSTTTGPIATLVADGWSTAPTTTQSDPPVQLHHHRHPPATAPPLA